MKIICSGCGAPHWLSDMQVSNGGCNVVCPRCSTSNYADASMIDPSSREPRWYYAFNDDTVGPLSTQDIEFSLQNGQISLDSYVWCEGFADWMSLGAVAELDYLASPVQGSPAGGDEATRVAGGGGIGFGAFGGGGEETAAIDLSEFQGSYSPFDQQSGGIMGMDGQAAVDDEPMMDMGPVTNAANELVGARSENSVLFSLSSLQAVSMAPEASSGPAVPVTAGGGAGLIDVKALASSSAPRRRANEVVDSFGGSNIPMATVLPLGNKAEAEGTKRIAIIGGIIGIVAIVLIIAVVVAMTGGKDEPVQAANVQAGAGADDLGVESETAKEMAKLKAEKEAAEAKAKKAEEEKKVAEEEKKAAEAAAEAAAAAEEEKAAEAAAAAEEEKAVAKEEKKTETKKTTTATKKADAGTTAKKTETVAKAEAPKKTETKKAAAAPAAGGNDLTKSEISSVIRGVGAQIRTCSRGSATKGKMEVSFTIKGDGRVSGARVVTPSFANTPTASCVLKVVNGMKFRAAGKDVPIKNYPFSIQ